VSKTGKGPSDKAFTVLLVLASSSQQTWKDLIQHAINRYLKESSTLSQDVGRKEED